MVKPLNPWDEKSNLARTDLPEGGYALTMEADTETIDGQNQLKVGRARIHEVYCDEPPRLGGQDRYPQPLTYIAMGVGF